MLALEMRDIVKAFGPVRALAGVSLQLQRGEVLGLVGQNGAGKSTLMKVLNGQIPAGSYSGEVLINGRAVQLHSPRSAAEAGVGMVPQETSVVGTLSVGENVLLGRYGGSFTSVGKMRRIAQSFLDEYAMPLIASDDVSSLATSDKQLIMIARALYAQPSILILDEPTTALTGEEVDRLLEVIRSLSKRGVTTVLVSHKLDEVFAVATQILIVRDGQVVDRLERSDFNSRRVVTGIAGRAIENVFALKTAIPRESVTLELNDVSVADSQYGRGIARNINLMIRAGEIVGVGGPLGSGRTEILEACAGLRPLRSGTMKLNGRPFSPSSTEQAVALGVSLVPEDRKDEGLFYNGSVAFNATASLLARLARLFFVSTRLIRHKAETEVARYSIKTPSVTAKIGDLSGGNQQKVLLARAASVGTAVLLLDEPTKGVDVGAKADIYRLVRTAAEQGTAVVVVSSEAPELVGLCDRIVILKEGRISSETEALLVDEHVLTEAAMTGRIGTPGD